jgi:hypothetical protein
MSNKKEEIKDVFNNMVLVYLAGKLGVKHGEELKVDAKDAQEAKEWVKKFMGV